MSDRRVYLGDLPPRSPWWRDCMLIMGGALTVILTFHLMSEVWRFLPGTVICKKHLPYEMVVRRD